MGSRDKIRFGPAQLFRVPAAPAAGFAATDRNGGRRWPARGPPGRIAAPTRRPPIAGLRFPQATPMAKGKKKLEVIHLVCEETGDQNYTLRRKTGGEKLKVKKYSPRLRKHTVHNEKRK